MKTDVDSALKDIADFYVKNRRSMTEAEFEPILKKHCESEAEVRKFVAFLQTEPGQTRFKIHLKERKDESSPSLLRETPGRLGEVHVRLWTGKIIPVNDRDEAVRVIKDELKAWMQEGDRLIWYNTEEDSKLGRKPSLAIVVNGVGEETDASAMIVYRLRSIATPGKFPKRDEALKKLGQVSIVEVHDDGDLTVRSGGKLYVVTTDGKTFEQTASYLKEPFVKVGERVRLIVDPIGKFRYGHWPEGVWLGEEAVMGTVERYHPVMPDVTIRGEYLPPIEAWAVVKWDNGADTALMADGEGKRWERIPEKEKPSYLKEATAVADTECQLISPQYYDILTWFNVPVPDYSFSIEPEVKERKIDEVLQKLKDGVATIHESSIFREFLTTMAKFWEYSFGNQLLIMLQRPGATRVAGFHTWKDLGRYVKAGERGIAILAPCLPPKALACPLCGNPFTERELRTHLAEVHRRGDISTLVREAREGAVAVPTPTYFKVVYVFDVSQTEGKPLPEIAVPVLSGAYSEVLYTKLMQLVAKHSLTVSFEPRPEQNPEIKGMLLGKEIWVKGDEPEAQRLKTLGHELAHYFTEAVYLIPRADAEVIAESVSFVVCAHSGFDTGTRAFPYVALWAKEKKVLEQNLASIRKISGRMIEELG